MGVTSPTADELVGALDALDVHFLSGGELNQRTYDLDPVDLFAALCSHSDARLRLAIIPLLLCHPEFAVLMPTVVERVGDTARMVLKFYYTAAILLQQIHQQSLHQLLGTQPTLPDLFGTELCISQMSDPHAGLHQLGERQAAFTGLDINWLGTYEHAAQRLIKRLEHEALWAIPQAV